MMADNERRRKLATLSLITIAVIVGFMLFSRMSVPTSFSFAVGTVKESTSAQVIELPESRISVQNEVSIKGQLIAPKSFGQEGNEEVYAYIPKFEGNLEIRADGEIVFSEVSPSYLGGSAYALFQVPMRANGALPVLEVTLMEQYKPFVLLSNVYLGSADDFQVAKLSQSIVSFLMISVFGMNVSVLLMSVLLIVNRTGLYPAAATAVICVYYLLASINSLNGIFLMPESFVLTLVLAAPIFSANLFLLGESLSGWARPARFWMLQGSSVLLSAIIILCSKTILANFAPLPLLVAVLCVILPVSFIIIRALIIGWSRHNYNMFFFGFMVSIFQFGLIHDLMVRFNFFSNDHYLISLVRISFVFGCAYLLASYTLAGSRQLENANIVLSEALQTRTNELMSQFSKTEQLLAQRAIAVEKRRIREEIDEELHDGALSYISVINVITGDSKDAIMMQINKLSRFATNEIRLLMETTERQPMSLLPAISLLRRQFIDRLSEGGIEVHFDVARLSKCGHIDHKIVLEYMRMLQELVHNAAVRADARRIDISGEPLSAQDGAGSIHHGFRLTVQNSGGKTYDPNQPGGNGIRNIAKRSKRVGGQFSIIPTEGGASATLIWTALDSIAIAPVEA